MLDKDSLSSKCRP